VDEAERPPMSAIDHARAPARVAGSAAARPAGLNGSRVSLPARPPVWLRGPRSGVALVAPVASVEPDGALLVLLGRGPTGALWAARS